MLLRRVVIDGAGSAMELCDSYFVFRQGMRRDPAIRRRIIFGS
jgi:hypothetical protein